jgi:hypothetical protein
MIRERLLCLMEFLEKIKNVNEFTKITKSVAAIFVKSGRDYYRLSSTLPDSRCRSSVGTILDTTSLAYMALKKGRSFMGRVDLFGRVYYAYYKPLFSDMKDGVVTVLFVGVPTCRTNEECKRHEYCNMFKRCEQLRECGCDNSFEEPLDCCENCHGRLDEQPNCFENQYESFNDQPYRFENQNEIFDGQRNDFENQYEIFDERQNRNDQLYGKNNDNVLPLHRALREEVPNQFENRCEKCNNCSNHFEEVYEKIDRRPGHFEKVYEKIDKRPGHFEEVYEKVDQKPGHFKEVYEKTDNGLSRPGGSRYFEERYEKVDERSECCGHRKSCKKHKRKRIVDDFISGEFGSVNSKFNNSELYDNDAESF